MFESSPTGKKTLWEKEKLLVTSNFSLSCSIFKRRLLQTHKKGLVWERAKTLIAPDYNFFFTNNLERKFCIFFLNQKMLFF